MTPSSDLNELVRGRSQVSFRLCLLCFSASTALLTMMVAQYWVRESKQMFGFVLLLFPIIVSLWLAWLSLSLSRASSHPDWTGRIVRVLLKGTGLFAPLGLLAAAARETAWLLNVPLEFGAGAFIAAPLFLALAAVWAKRVV